MATSTEKSATKKPASRPAPTPAAKAEKPPIMEVEAAPADMTIIEEAEEVLPSDDLQEGIMAEMDPRSQMKDRLIDEKAPAIDIVKQSLDTQITNLGRQTAKKLEKHLKRKVVIPKDPLNPKDEYGVPVAINGWTYNIPRGKSVYLPDPVIDVLIGAGYNPTLVR